MADKINRLKTMARALRDLHRAIVERVRRDYEQERGSVLSAGEFLHLLTTDSRFAWLHPLSGLMVDLDVLLEADPSPTEDEAAAVRVEIEQLITVSELSTGANVFAVHYVPLIADDPHIAMEHARVRQLIQGLPKANNVDEAEVLHETHRWNEQRRHRR